MRVFANNCLVRFVNEGTNSKGQPYAIAFIQQNGQGGVTELSIDLTATEGLIPERDTAYDFDVDVYTGGNYGTSMRVKAFDRAGAPALVKTG